MTEMYTDPCYGVKMQHIFPTQQDAAAATGQLHSNIFRMPFKAKLCKIGVIPMGASPFSPGTDTCFHLKTTAPALLATFVPGSSAVLSTQVATGCAPETATCIKKNILVQPGIGATDIRVASAGSVLHFMEYQRVYDGGN